MGSKLKFTFVFFYIFLLFGYMQSICGSELFLYPVFIEKEGKCTYIDAKGIVKTEARYDECFCFNEGFAVVKQKDKYGFIDSKGNYLVRPIYLNCSSFCEGLAAVKLNGKWGYIDSKGKIAIPYKYDYASKFSENKALVLLDHTGDKIQAYIDKSGKVLKELDPRYSYFDYNDGLAACCKGELDNAKCGYVDTNLRWQIPPKYEAADIFSEGLAAVKEGGKFGYIDKKGSFVIKPKYLINAGVFKNGIAAVRESTYKDRNEKIPYAKIRTTKAYIFRMNKMGYINAKGENLVPFKYDMANKYYEGIMEVVITSDDLKESTTYIINTKNEIIWSGPGYRKNILFD